MAIRCCGAIAFEHVASTSSAKVICHCSIPSLQTDIGQRSEIQNLENSTAKHDICDSMYDIMASTKRSEKLLINAFVEMVCWYCSGLSS